MDTSIITSLYASGRHLPAFLVRLEECLKSVEGRGYSAESILVANAPDRRERRILSEALASSWWQGHSQLLVVSRETLYASWNRGLRASSGSAVGFWNVDDYRNPAAIAEGIELVRQGHLVVRFPWIYVREGSPARSRDERIVLVNDREAQAGLDPELDFCLGPFFMFDRRLFGEYGPFDEQFHVVGDYDWQLRVVPHTGLDWAEQPAGVFATDGTNLCGNGSARPLLEENILIERYGLSRAPWPLDDRARELIADYNIPPSMHGGSTTDWTYERQWRRRQISRRLRDRCRRLAGVPLRLVASWRRDFARLPLNEKRGSGRRP
jgi:hypothetical protein